MRHEIVAPTDCTIVEIRPEPGDSVPAGVTIAIVEMMKIERLVDCLLYTSTLPTIAVV